MKADFDLCTCFVTKHHCTALPWFSFFFFLNPVVFCSYCNVNTARSSTVLDNLSLNMYIFIIKFGYNARCHWLKERAL